MAPAKKVNGDGGRDQRQRPASCLDDVAQEDRRSVEAHPPSEDRQDEGGAHHPPSVEGAATCHRGHGMPSAEMSRRVPSRPGTLRGYGRTCYGGGRSIGVAMRVECRRRIEEVRNGQQCHVRGSRRARRRSRSRRDAARVDGWARAHGVRAGTGRRHHAADRERPPGTHGRGRSARRREAGQASLSSAGIADGGADDREHHAGGVEPAIHAIAATALGRPAGRGACGRPGPATTISPAVSALRWRMPWWPAVTPSWRTTPAW